MPLQQGAVKIQYGLGTVVESAHLWVVHGRLKVIHNQEMCESESREHLHCNYLMFKILLLRLQASNAWHTCWSLPDMSVIFLCVSVSAGQTQWTLISTGSSPSGPAEMPLCRRIIPPCLTPSTTAVCKSRYITVSVCPPLPRSPSFSPRDLVPVLSLTLSVPFYFMYNHIVLLFIIFFA